MPAYYVLPANEPAAPMSFDDRAVAIAWCKAQPGKYKVIEMPNSHGSLPVINLATAKPVFAT